MSECCLTIREEGIMLGATVLAEFAKGKLRMDDAKILALLSVAYGYVPAADILRKFHRAGKAYKAGEKVLALMHLALAGLPALERMEQVRELALAEKFLSGGGTLPVLLRHAGIESILDDANALYLYKLAAKFNPNHIPAGSPEGGQFTTAEGARGGGGNISEDSPRHRVLDTKSLGEPGKTDGSNDRVDSSSLLENTALMLSGAGETWRLAGGIKEISSLLENGRAVDNEISNIITRANQITGNDGIVVSSKSVAESAAKQFVGKDSVPMYDRNTSEYAGQRSADSSRRIRYTSSDKSDPYINFETKSPGGNLHVRWKND